MNSRDRLIEQAMKQQAEMERNPTYKMLLRQIDEEQRNPALRMAREQLEREERNPALKFARQQIEEEQRNPGLRIARERLEQENRNPFLRIARERAAEHLRFDSLYRITSRSVSEMDRYLTNDRLRSWEQKLPDWILNPKSQGLTGFGAALGRLTEAERAAERFARLPHVGIRDMRLHDWDRFATISQELSVAFRSLPPEMNNTFLVGANRQLELIRESVENHDATTLDHEFQVFVDYVLSWIRNLGSKVLTNPAASALLVSVLIAAGQVALSYKWRLDDKKDADARAHAQNEKLDSVLRAIRERTTPKQAYLGKSYLIQRTTRVFGRPGSKRPVIGYVYVGQSVLATATTGRWIFIEYTDRFSLEQRAGWIRKKYAKLETNSGSARISDDNETLFLAINLFEIGKLSLGQAAQLAGFSKRDFIDVLGQHHIPVVNYSAEDLREEIGV